MKKTLLAIAAIATIGLTGYQFAEARPGYGPGNGNGPCAQGQLDEATTKARDKFFNDTAELRKKMTVKHAELNAVLAAATPDEKKAAKLSEELFDLRETMQKKAQESGIAGKLCGGFGGGMGMGMGMGMGPGMMRGAW
ncbi:MAG: periplasmic heavy metal sensor [Thermodesulfobacteriota bacterium]